MNVVCIIPARGGSKRLPRKNMFPLFGKPLLQWSIEACLKSEFLDADKIYVSSEDEEILEFATSMAVNTIQRPQKLSGDKVWTQDVLKHAASIIEETKSIDLIVRVQANSPQLMGAKIDECINKLIDNDLWEVFTVDQYGIEDAAIHVMKYRCVNQKALSVYKGVVTTDYIDIHTKKDVDAVEEKMKGC